MIVGLEKVWIFLEFNGNKIFIDIKNSIFLRNFLKYRKTIEKIPLRKHPKTSPNCKISAQFIEIYFAVAQFTNNDSSLHFKITSIIFKNEFSIILEDSSLKEGKTYNFRREKEDKISCNQERQSSTSRIQKTLWQLYKVFPKYF